MGEAKIESFFFLDCAGEKGGVQGDMQMGQDFLEIKREGFLGRNEEVRL